MTLQVFIFIAYASVYLINTGNNYQPEKPDYSEAVEECENE